MGQRRKPPARWVLPTNVHPASSKCYLVQVPDDPLYLAAFRGALLNLASARQWQDDPAHTALQVAGVWRNIYDAVIEQECVPVCPIPIAEMDYDMSVCEQLRFQGGKLQGLCCGTWSDISGQTGLPIDGGGNGQPGVGNGTPTPGGGCQLYHADFRANGRWLLPGVVNAGDTLAFSNAQGAASDGALGSFSAWWCPDGGQFFAGLNAGGKRHVAGDLSGGLFHMQLMALISGVYYDASQGTITVPGGVVNAQVFLLVNDQTPGDDDGGFSVDVTWCNNLTASWSHTFDFTLSQYGWLASLLTGTPLAAWTAGVGWQQIFIAPGSGFRALTINRPLGVTRTITQMTAYFTIALGATPASAELDYLATALAGVTTNRVQIGYATPPASPWATALFAGNADTLIASFTVGKAAGGADPGGTMTLTKIVVTGQGSDPF